MTFKKNCYNENCVYKRINHTVFCRHYTEFLDVKVFFAKILYGSPLVGITLPVKSFSGAAIVPNPLPLENSYNALDILKMLPQFDKYASENALSFRAIHGFAWLCDVLSFSELTIEHKILLRDFMASFIEKYNRYDKDLWHLPLLSQRLFFSLHAYERLLTGAGGHVLKDKFLPILLRQAMYLRKKLRFHKNTPDYALLLIRSSLCCLCLSEERAYLQPTLAVLYAHLDNIFTSDGGHSSRNATLHFRILTELIALRDVLVKAGVSVPVRLQSIIAKSCDYLQFLRHPDGGFAIFNGSSEGFPTDINKIFSLSPSKVIAPAGCLKEGHYYRLEAGDVTILADFYRDFSQNKFKRLFGGALAFELSIGKKRVFSNCGNGEDFGNEWKEALLKSDAHNTMSIKGHFCKPIAQDPIIPGKKRPAIISAVTPAGIVLEGAHAFECSARDIIISHHRRILLHKNGHIIQGEDWICQNKNKIIKLKKSSLPDNKDLECLIRFHLSPEVDAYISRTGSVIITIPDVGERIFNVGSGKISLEESVYVGQGQPHPTKQIVIRIPLSSDVVKIRWTMQLAQKRKISEDNNHADIANANENINDDMDKEFSL